jgi:hypothetical protein
VDFHCSNPVIQIMSAEEEMDYQSLPSRSIDASPTPIRRRTSTRLRGRSLNSPLGQNLSRAANSITSTPKSTRRSDQHSTQPLAINASSNPTTEKNGNLLVSVVSPIVASNPSYRSPPPVPSQTFDCGSDDEQRPKRTVSTTTRSGKMKKDAVLSYFTIRPDERYDCNICHQVGSIFYRIF